MDKCLILYTLEGEGRIEYEDKEFLLKPGYLIAFDCRKYHYYGTAEDKWHFLWLHFAGNSSFDYVNLLNEGGGVPVYLGKRALFSDYYEKLLSYCGHIGLQEELDIALIMQKLMTELIRLKREEVFQNQYSRCQKEMDESIVYMKAHFQEEISIELLAENCHLSKYYYIKVFKSYTGQTPYDYLLRLRIQQAQRLLLETDESVETIGRETGFGESKNFIACFKKKTGNTPLQYRKRNRFV